MAAVGSRRLELRAGARLDRYELMFPLAEGGMAAVWLARLRGKRGFEQLVAIKTIKAHLSEDLRFEEMFLDEARIASRIRHPNVAQILDLGEEQGILYLVMEWVDGDSLSRTRRLVQKHGAKIPLRIALRIMADVAAGLHAAHEQKDESGATLGVIHRDVSPQNILVSTSGSVKVIDFGIAKARNRASAETTDGLVKGKVAYMSPEQAEGLPLDRRADVWAAGVCLYELVTGKLPFDGDSQQEILRLLVRGTAVPPLPNDLPSVVRGVIEQALARDPANRFLTASALERALEGALTTLDSPTTSDDIATFLNTTCPERLQARREMLAEVEKVTESLDAGEPQTKDVTPASTKTTVTPVLATSVATQPSDSIDVRISDAGKEPIAFGDLPQDSSLHSSIVETQVTHSAERAVSATASPSSKTPRLLAFVGLALLLGGVGLWARSSFTSSKTVTPTPTPEPTLSVTGPAASSSSSPVVAVPPDPTVSATATTSAVAIVPSSKPPPPPTSVRTAMTTTIKPAAKPAASAPASATSVSGGIRYDADGIPIGPKK